LYGVISARFTYRLDRLKPRASKYRGPPTNVYNIFNTVIGLSHVCCHNVLYFLNNPSVISPTHCRPLIIFAFIEIDLTHFHIPPVMWRIGRGLTSAIA
jgi:hypothetical protein